MHKNVVSLCQNNLYNKNWRSTKRKKASFKELGYLSGFEKGISSRKIIFLEFVMINIRSHKTTYGKMAHKAMFKIVMLMRDFLARSVFVVTFFLRKLFCQMFITMHKLEQD